MTIRRSSLAVSGSSCSSSDGKSSGCRPIQAPTYRLSGSVTLAPIWEERQTRNKAAVQSRQVRIRYNNLSSCHYISKNNANMYRPFLNRSAPRVLQEALLFGAAEIKPRKVNSMYVSSCFEYSCITHYSGI